MLKVNTAPPSRLAQMRGIILVVETPYFARSDPEDRNWLTRRLRSTAAGNFGPATWRWIEAHLRVKRSTCFAIEHYDPFRLAGTKTSASRARIGSCRACSSQIARWTNSTLSSDRFVMAAREGRGKVVRDFSRLNRSHVLDD